MITRKPGPPYEPELESIRKACEEIQAGWTEKERNKRKIRKTPELTVPEVDINEIIISYEKYDDYKGIF